MSSTDDINNDQAASLFELAAKGEIGLLDSVLRRDSLKASARSEQGISLLMWAMYHRQANAAATIYQYLLKPEASEVVALNDLLKLKQLLEVDPGLISEVSSDGFTLLHYACFFGHIECSSFLIELDAKINIAAQNPSKVYPLHSAVAAQVPSIVKLLLEFGADANVQQNGGFTALMSAAAHNNNEIIDLLLASKADIAIKDESGKTAYDHGLEKGFDLVRIKS